MSNVGSEINPVENLGPVLCTRGRLSAVAFADEVLDNLGRKMGTGRGHLDRFSGLLRGPACGPGDKIFVAIDPKLIG